ncbi:MAG: biotin--[acetyl-CoA-carboxylase] ligase [Candidatus Lambdaproteobacteria bacterium]|nr:biotin--[acetyl-CoA-carboxylase] ligase [Candidatus Lambdaproteobacteria bacterium]
MKPLGHTIIRLTETRSTNLLVMETPTYLDNHGLVVVTPRQSAGRGRMGRKFISLPGEQLLFSVVLHPQLPPETLSLLSLVAGVCVADALEAELGVVPELKWPNDVLIGGRKVCGILVELRHGAERAARVVLGIGINCHGTTEDIPPELRSVITTLAHETGHPIDTRRLLEAILRQLELRLGALEDGAVTSLLDRWRARARLAGRRVLLSEHPQRHLGTVQELMPSGALRIRLDSGEMYLHHSGALDWLD